MNEWWDIRRKVVQPYYKSIGACNWSKLLAKYAACCHSGFQIYHNNSLTVCHCNCRAP